MNHIKIKKMDPKSESKTVVLVAYKDGAKASCKAAKCGCDESLLKFDRAVENKSIKGEAKEALFFRDVMVDDFENLLILGIGANKTLTSESLRILGATLVKNLKKEKQTSASLCLNSLQSLFKDPRVAGQALAEGVGLTGYSYDELKSKSDKKDEGKFSELFIWSDDKKYLEKFMEGVERGEAIADAVNKARRLGNTPSNLMTPKLLAEAMHEGCKGLPIKFKALGLKEIESLKMGSFLSVAQGSNEEPRFIIMEYNGGKKTDKPLVFVGKGVTFDTGGISIKPSASMEEMKFDMCGSAAVFGAIVALAKLKAKVNVVSLVPATENMPSGSAIKPGDVVTAMNGKTIEINNTDAEGRLILADALCYACDNYKPEFIIDAATLTGACVMALGTLYTGVFSTNEKVLRKLLDASVQTGEKIWRLPLAEEHVTDTKGTYADLSNITTQKSGGASIGAAFLSCFVKEEVPWAHLDIAGTAYNVGGRLPYHPDKGASGVAARLLVQLALNEI